MGSATDKELNDLRSEVKKQLLKSRTGMSPGLVVAALLLSAIGLVAGYAKRETTISQLRSEVAGYRAEVTSLTAHSPLGYGAFVLSDDVAVPNNGGLSLSFRVHPEVSSISDVFDASNASIRVLDAGVVAINAVVQWENPGAQYSETDVIETQLLVILAREGEVIRKSGETLRYRGGNTSVQTASLIERCQAGDEISVRVEHADRSQQKRHNTVLKEGSTLSVTRLGR